MPGVVVCRVPRVGHHGWVWLFALLLAPAPASTASASTALGSHLPGLMIPVLVFSNSSYVDTSWEVKNVLEDLDRANISHSSFESTAAGSWSPAATALVVPELERSFLTLTAAARGELEQWVRKGGRLLVLGSVAGLVFLNSVFQWGLKFGGFCISSCAVAVRSVGGCGLFCSGPHQLEDQNAVVRVRSDSVPTGASVAYSEGDKAWVFSVQHFTGQVVYLGHDWYHRPPSPWSSLLRPALSAVPPPPPPPPPTTSTTTATTTATTTSGASHPRTTITATPTSTWTPATPTATTPTATATTQTPTATTSTNTTSTPTSTQTATTTTATTQTSTATTRTPAPTVTATTSTTSTTTATTSATATSTATTVSTTSTRTPTSTTTATASATTTLTSSSTTATTSTTSTRTSTATATTSATATLTATRTPTATTTSTQTPTSTTTATTSATTTSTSSSTTATTSTSRTRTSTATATTSATATSTSSSTTATTSTSSTRTSTTTATTSATATPTATSTLRTPTASIPMPTSTTTATASPTTATTTTVTTATATATLITTTATATSTAALVSTTSQAGAEVVQVNMTFSGINFAALEEEQNEGVRAELISAVEEGILSVVDSGLTREHMETEFYQVARRLLGGPSLRRRLLYVRDVVAVTVITPPSGVEPEDIEESVQKEAKQLQEAVQSNAGNISGVTAVTDGTPIVVFPPMTIIIVLPATTPAPAVPVDVFRPLMIALASAVLLLLLVVSALLGHRFGCLQELGCWPPSQRTPMPTIAPHGLTRGDPIMISGRFNEEERTQNARRLRDAMGRKGFRRVLLVEAVPGGTQFGQQTMQYMCQCRGMVALVTADYGEKTECPFCTYHELEYWLQNQRRIRLLPVKLCNPWPPQPPGEKGAQLCQWALAQDMPYIDWHGRELDPEAIADALAHCVPAGPAAAGDDGAAAAAVGAPGLGVDDVRLVLDERCRGAWEAVQHWSGWCWLSSCGSQWGAAPPLLAD